MQEVVSSNPTVSKTFLILWNGLTKRFDGGDEKLFDGTVSRVVLASTVNEVRRKLHMAGIHLTVGKQAKRMQDTTFETTD